MGTKLPSSVASSNIHGDNLAKEDILQEKYAWQHDRAIQFNPVASILRYTEGTSNPSAHIEGSYILVSGLSDLACSFDDYTKSFERKYGSVVEKGNKIFTFYNVEVLINDRIDYKGNLWQPVERWYDEKSGRCDVQVKLIAET